MNEGAREESCPTDSGPSPSQASEQMGAEVKTFEFYVKREAAQTAVRPAGGAQPHRRIDSYLASRFPDYSRTFIKKLMEQGAVTVGGVPVKPSYAPRPGDHVIARVPVLSGASVEPEDIALDILYEDDWIVVVNKPPDMVVHPAKGHQSGTLVNALAYHCEKLSSYSGELRSGIVHRLDRDTSGVILLVKDESVHQSIAQQFESRRVRKEYVAVCEGRVELDSNVIEAPIGPHARLAERMAVRFDVGREAKTVYEVVERLGEFTVVRCFPHTGRTHQIRVHLQHIGHPIVCDASYGRRDAIYPSDLTGEESQPFEEPILDRQALHARRLIIHHPVLGRELCFEAPMPADMMALIRALRERVA